jgi:hypothetical protein
MRRLALSALTAAMAWAQRPDHYIDIQLGPGVKAESVFIRYILDGEELGGRVQPRAGITDYIISTTRGAHTAARFRALLYAPECGIQTVDLALSDTSNPETDFDCRAPGEVTLRGRITRAERLLGREVKVQARYLARWAKSFLGNEQILVAIPLGDAIETQEGGRFELQIPDLARDAVAGAPDHPGEIQIWAVDKATGEDVVRLSAVETTNETWMGGLKVQAQYQGETVFAPCQIPGAIVMINREGLAADPCNPQGRSW